MPPSPAEPHPGPLTDELVAAVYDELRAAARAYFRKQPPGFTLRPTELVNEACLHLIQHGKVNWQSSEHFRAIATRKIWQVVVDHLKKRYAEKRGGMPHRARLAALGADYPTRPGPAAASPPRTGPPARPAPANLVQPAGPWGRVPLDSVNVEWRDGLVDLLDLAEALDALAAESRRLNDVVTLHWFGGMTHAEVARALGVSTSTAEKDFRYALAWLNRRLTGASPDGRG